MNRPVSRAVVIGPREPGFGPAPQLRMQTGSLSFSIVVDRGRNGAGR
jgi:hypothetical protein